MIHSVTGARKKKSGGFKTLHTENKIGGSKIISTRLGRLTDDWEAALALEKSGYSSALEIARTEENEFVRTWCGDFGVPPSEGRQIHKRAQAVCEKVNNLFMNIRTSVGSPVFRSFEMNTVGSQVTEYFEKLPEYRELFGEEQGCICDKNDSIFGAPAYFTDLMRIADKFITSANPSIPEELKLAKRRPDLWHIPLTEQAAAEEVPYVRIINQRLLTVLPDEEDPYKIMAAELVHPFLFPTNIQLLRIRACLAERGTSLDELYGLFDGEQEAQGREAMGLSLEQWQLIETEQKGEAELKHAYGLQGQERPADLADLELFLGKTELSKEELLELLDLGLLPGEEKTACQFYYNCVLEKGEKVELSVDEKQLTNLTNEVLDRLHRFLRLKKALGISAASLDRLLLAVDMREKDIRGDLPETMEVILSLAKIWDLSMEAVCDFLAPLRCYGKEAPGGTSYRQIFQGSQAASYRPQNPWNETYEDHYWTWTPYGDEKSHEERTTWLAQGLGIKADDVEELGKAIFSKKIELTVEALSAMYRWVKLAGIFSVSVPVMLIYAANAGVKAAPCFGIEDLRALRQLYDFLNDQPLTAYQLDYFLTGRENGYINHLFREEMMPGWMKQLQKQYGTELNEDTLLQEVSQFLQIEKEKLELFFGLAEYWTPLPAGVSSWAQAFLAPPKEGSDLPEHYTAVKELLQAISRWERLDGFCPQEACFWKAIGESPEAYDIPVKEESSTAFWLMRLLQIPRWTAEFDDKECAFLTAIALLFQGDKEGLSYLAEVIGNKVETLFTLYTDFTPAEESALRRTKRLIELHKAMLQLNLAPELLKSLRDLTSLSAVEWQKYVDTADQVAQCILRFYQGESRKAFQGRLESMEEGIKRTLLLKRAIQELHSRYSDISKADDVYKFLLIDVQMGEETDVSYISEGISAVQLYLQRCRLKLERGVKHVDIPESWWDWIISLPLWEANRKIFVYPENYLLPSLRHTKTSLFENLDNELSQGELTAANVEDAFHEYLDAFSAVSTLTILESYECEVPDEKGVFTHTYFLFGKTKSQPYTYYYCICESGHPWSEWMKIGADIHSDKLTPVYVFGSLYLFWLEKKETSASKIAAKDGEPTSEDSKSHHMSIYFTYQNLRKEWMPSQSLKENQLIYHSDYGANPSLVQNKELLDAYNLDEIPWQKLYAIPVTSENFDPGAGKKEDFERLVLFFGEHFQYAGNTIEMEPVRQDGTDRSAFEGDLYDRFHIYNRMVKTNELGYLHVQDTLVLNQDLQPDHLLEGDEYLLVDGAWKLSSPIPFKPVMDTIHRSLGIRYSGSAILDNYISDTKNVELHQFQRRTSGENAFTSPSIDVEMSKAIRSALEDSEIMDFQGHLRLNKLADYDLSQLAALIREKNGGKAFNQSQLLHLLEVMMERNGGAQLFGQVGEPEATIYPVLNKVGDFILDNGDETFLLSYEGDFDSLSKGLQVRKPEINELTVRTISEKLEDSQVVLRLKESCVISEDGIIQDEKVTRDNIHEVLSSVSGLGDKEIESVYRILKGYPLVEELDFYSELAVEIRNERSKDRQIILTLRKAGVIDQEGVIKKDQVTKENIHKIVSSIPGFREEETGVIFRYLSEHSIVDKEDFFSSAVTMELSEKVYGVLKDKGIIADCGRVDMNQLLDQDPQTVLKTLLEQGLITAPKIAGLYSQMMKTPAAVCLRYENRENQEKVNDLKDVKYSVVRLSTHAVGPLRQRLTHGGIKRLLSLESQQIPVQPVFPFERLCADPEKVFAPEALDGQQVDFSGLYGEYFWEIFYHAPMNIAAALQADQKFEEAQKWMQYIFLPSAVESFVDINALYEESAGKIDKNLAEDLIAKLSATGILDPEGRVAVSFNVGTDLSFLLGIEGMTGYKLIVLRRILLNNQLAVPSAYYWQFRPFRHHSLESMTDILADDHAAMKVYNDDPFDPHAIARLRIGAYEKYTVSQYISNILAWADQLFAEDTWEAITRATMLYVLALSMLGKKPEIAKNQGRKPRTFEDIQTKYKTIPQILIQLEDSLDEETVLPAKQEHFMGEPVLYFAIPENEQLLSLWDRIEDRLGKIRNSMNIKGEKRKLALYSPSIDPLLPARAAAADSGGEESFPQNVHLLNLRFSYLLEKAKEYCREIQQLGQELLGALEKQDAEGISLLHTSQEKALLNLLTAMKNYQIEQVKAEKMSLENMRTAAEKRYFYYNNLCSSGLLSEETNQLDYMKQACDFSIASNVLHTAAGVGYAAPQVGSPFAMTYGGIQLGAVLTAAAAATDIGALVSNYNADRSRIRGEHKRRANEWSFQSEQAECEIDSFNAQLESAKKREQAADLDLKCHLQSISQSEEMYQALSGKYTNRELYQWMKGKLAGIYWQVYQMGLTLALQAEKAFQLEFGTEDSFLSFQCWDSLRAGLLCSENLTMALRRMEHSSLQRQSRSLEIEKVISLAQTEPEELIRLKKTGVCNFSITEMMLDADFPGHYARKISSISITIPAVTGPYDNVKATLSQTGNLIMTRPDQEDAAALLAGKEPTGEGIRKNWLAGQKVVLSRGVEDSGVLVLTPGDERYLPFECTGAVSKWELKMPIETNEISFESISDVFIRLTYTAKEDYKLKEAVKALLKTYPRASSLLYFLSQNFSGNWNAFMRDHEAVNQQSFCAEFQFSQMRKMKDNNFTGVYFYLETAEEICWEQVSPCFFVVLPNGKEYEVTFRGDIGCLELGTEKIGVPAGEWKLCFRLDAMKKDKKLAALLKEGFLDPDQWKGIEMFVTYEGLIY